MILETRNNIELHFEPLSEDLALEDTFDDTVSDLEEIAQKIYTGDYVYFCAHVYAMKNGIKLADDYLGACLYSSTDEFINSRDYIEDMKKQVYQDAMQAIEELTFPH